MDASKWPPTRLSATTTAPPQVVYDVLTDLRTHLSWGGNDKNKVRLTTFQAPDEPATTGTEFRSTGLDMMGNSFDDTSVVIEATPPSVFEFRTNAHMTYKKQGRDPWDIVVEHRYEITPEGAGSRVDYVSAPKEANHLAWYLTTPGVRSMTGMMIRSALGKGFHGMLKMAEQRAATG